MKEVRALECSMGIQVSNPDLARFTAICQVGLPAFDRLLATRAGAGQLDQQSVVDKVARALRTDWLFSWWRYHCCGSAATSSKVFVRLSVRFVRFESLVCISGM